MPKPPDEYTVELAEALREHINRLTPIEPDDFYKNLDDDAIDLAYFIVEIVALEATVHAVVARHGAKTAKQLENATLGNLIQWVEPILKKHDVEQMMIDDLWELNWLRIAVVHRLPTVSAAWDDTHIWLIAAKDPDTGVEGEVRVRDLHPYGTMAWLRRKRLSEVIATWS